jgi:hypothetical protein
MLRGNRIPIAAWSARRPYDRIYVAELPPLNVEIEVRRKRIKPHKGRVRVALYGSETFDPTSEIDLDTLGFGPADAEPRKIRIRDLDHDGFEDLLVKFRVRDTGIEAGDEEACLYGETLTGVPFEGCDHVRTVGRRQGF